MIITPNNKRVESKASEYDKSLSYLVALYCMALPFEEALAGSLGSILRILGLVIIVRCILLSPGEVLRSNSYYLPLFLWLSYSFFSIFWASSVEWWQYYIKIYAYQFIVLFCVSAQFARVDLRYLLKGAMLGAFIASLLLLLFPTSSNLTDDGRRTVILLGANLDPNIVGGIIILGFYSCMGYFAIYGSESRFNVRLSKLLIQLVLLLGLLYTGSRGCLIALLAGLFAKVVLDLLSVGKKGTAVATVVFGILGFAVVASVLPEELIRARFSPEAIFGLNEVKTGSHNRYTIWMHSMQLIEEHPMIGCGCGNFISAIEAVYRSCASHNLYVLLLVEGGIIGFVLFMVQIMRFVFDLRKLEHRQFFTMLISMLVLAVSLDTIPYKYFWVALMICYVYIKQTKVNNANATRG